MALRNLRVAAQGSQIWSIHDCTFNAKTPLLSLMHVPSACMVDLTVNNSACVAQSIALCSPSTALQSPHAQNLVRLVKLWACKRQVYGKAHGRLGGYALTQMVMFFVQIG